MKIISKNIRQLAGNKLKHFTVTQGSCSDNKYVYMIFERKPNKKRSHRCKILIYDLKTEKIIKISNAMKLGHGNDICIRNNILYITHSEGSKIIHRVNAKTLKQLKGIKVKIPKKYKSKKIKAFNAIECYGSGFILRVMGGSGMIIVNKNFKVIRFFRTKTNYKTSQGMTLNRKTIIRAYSDYQKGKNYLVEYSIKGVEKKRSKLKLKGEMEAIFIHNNEIYVTTYIRKNNKYEAYIAKM